jgi:hypothetical protein
MLHLVRSAKVAARMNGGHVRNQAVSTGIEAGFDGIHRVRRSNTPHPAVPGRGDRESLQSRVRAIPHALHLRNPCRAPRCGRARSVVSGTLGHDDRMPRSTYAHVNPKEP